MNKQPLFIAALALCVSVAQAQTQTVPAPGSVDAAIAEIKKPVDWFSWGGDFRVRNEYFNNALSLTTHRDLSPLFAPVHEQDYFRFRGRLWLSIVPVEDLSFNLRLAAEPREFLKTSTMDTFDGKSGMQWRYGIVDNLNVQWRNAFSQPATLTVGRQDIFLGDGWLMGDGTPEDGSFTLFLDSARLTYTLKEQQTTIDFIGIVQDGRPDAWLPTLGPTTTFGGHPEPYLLTDQNEKGIILWVANKTLPSANLDGYFIYKHDNRVNNPPDVSNPPAVNFFGDNADIYTFGGRVSGPVAEHWKYSVEGAYQFGRKQEADLNQGGLNPLLAPGAETTGNRAINAFGVTAKLSYLFHDQWSNQVSLAYEFLSGDNPKTKDDEMFDVLWGRWPQWSEMYNIYGSVAEARVGQIDNLHRIGPSWSVKPIKDMAFSLSYYALLADQNTPTRDLNLYLTKTTPYSDSGDFRGHYVQAILKYKFNEYLSGHLWAEVLFPGDYYATRAMQDFLRAEVMVKF